MGDYCKACAEKLGMELTLAGITTPDDVKDGKACLVVCEGCGPIQVDPEGYCTSPDCLEHGHVGHGVPLGWKFQWALKTDKAWVAGPAVDRMVAALLNGRPLSALDKGTPEEVTLASRVVSFSPIYYFVDNDGMVHAKPY